MTASKMPAIRPFRLRLLYILLASSLLTNFVFALRLYNPDILATILQSYAPPPTIEPSDHIRGNPNSKTTVIVYTDFECPYCARLHSMLLALSKETDMRLVYRHFPLNFHPHAQQAAEAAECSGAQGKFWEYADALFNTIKSADNDNYFLQVASSLKLNSKEFSTCLASGTFANRVAVQYQEGVQRKLMAVPTFFVNGKRFNGVVPIEQLKSIVAKSSE